MAAAIRPRSAVAAMAGPAFTVRCEGDFFGAVRGIEAAAPGDVLVVDGGGREVAYAGELFARAALGRGLAGIVVDGGYRDIGWVSRCPLPVWSRHVVPMAGTTRLPGVLAGPVACGGVPVAPGNIVVADEDGIIVCDPSRIDAAVAAARRVEELEARVVAALEEGRGIGECLNIVEHAAALEAGEESRLRFTV